MAHGFRIGEWLLEPDRNRISRGDHSLVMEPLVTRLLVYLAERPGETASRKELFDELWGSVSVGDETLTVTVGKARKALGDDPRAPRYIQTVPKQGYKLISSAHPVEEPARNPSRGRRRISVLAVITVVLAGLWWIWPPPGVEPPMAVESVDSLVVLPSRVDGEDEEQFLSGAIPSFLSTNLNVLSDLEIKVTPGETDLAELRGDLSRIAAIYGVSALVLSDVTLDGPRMTLNVRLAAAEDRSLLWSRTFTGNREELVDLVEEAGDALRVRLRPNDAVSHGSTTSGNRDARVAFEKGMYHVQRYNHLQDADSFEPALAALTRAYELDPDYADAAAEIAWLYSYTGATREKYHSEIDTWVRRAFDADPNCGRASMLLVWRDQINPSMGPRERLPAALRAATYAPRGHMAHFLLGFAFRSSSAALAAASFQEASRRYPLYPYSAVYRSLYLPSIGRSTEALEAVEEALRVSPDMPFALLSKGLIMAQHGSPAEARATSEKLERLVEEGRGFVSHALIVRHAAAMAEGSLDESEAIYHELMKVMPEGSRSSEGALVLFTLLRWGDYDEALEHMKLVFAAGHRPPYDSLSSSLAVERFGGEPIVQEQLARSREAFKEMLAVVEEAEARGELPPYLEQPLANLRSDMTAGPPSD